MTMASSSSIFDLYSSTEINGNTRSARSPSRMPSVRLEARWRIRRSSLRWLARWHALFGRRFKLFIGLILRLLIETDVFRRCDVVGIHLIIVQFKIGGLHLIEQTTRPGDLDQPMGKVFRLLIRFPGVFAGLLLLDLVVLHLHAMLQEAGEH